MRTTVLLALASSVHALDISCQIFDGTMVCDGDKGRVSRGEIQSCSG